MITFEAKDETCLWRLLWKENFLFTNTHAVEIYSYISFYQTTNMNKTTMKLSLNICITWYDYISKKIRVLGILLRLIFSKSNDFEYVM